MLTGGFFVFLLRVVINYGLPAVPVFIFLSFSPSPFGPMGSLLEGAVVVRGHPGDVSGFPVEIWILGYSHVLVAGKLCPQQSLFSFLFFSISIF